MLIAFLPVHISNDWKCTAEIRESDGDTINRLDEAAHFTAIADLVDVVVY